MRNIVLYLCLVLLPFSALNITTQKTAMAQRAQLVVLEAVQMGAKRHEERRVLGKVKALEYGTIAARLSGEITKINAQIGDKVQAGAVLAEIDNSAYLYRQSVRQSQLASAKAALEVTKRRLERQLAEIKRLDRLRGSAAFSAARLENFEIEANIERANIVEKQAAIAQKQAELKLSQLEVALTKIKAPFAGVVLEKYINLGSFVNPGSEGFALLNQNAFEIESLVGHNMVQQLEIGQALQILKIEDVGVAIMQGEIRAILPQMDARTQNRKILISLIAEESADEENMNFTDGEQVEILLSIKGAQNALSIPKDALVIEGNKNYVFTVQDMIAKKQEIRLGKAVGDRLQVLSGLEKGDVLVVKGNERLSDGTKIKQ